MLRSTRDDMEGEPVRMNSALASEFRSCGLVAAVAVAPPDVISQLALAIPMCLLYEVGIFVAKGIEKKKAQQEAAFEAELRGEAAPGAEKKPTA